MLPLGLFALALFVVGLSGLPNLFDNECRLGESVLDVVQNGNWLCPHDALGHTDKPPLLTWLSALVTLATGRVDRLTLYLPSALATATLAGAPGQDARRGVSRAAFGRGRSRKAARSGAPRPGDR
jgi:4-amino-4-deoxy-L-arabinose transferase-like glycosyltransferase